MLAIFLNKGKHSLSPSCSLLRSGSFTGAAHDSQDVKENVDDVGVEVEGSKNVLLWTQGQLLVAQKKLSVHSQKLQRRKKRKKRVALVISSNIINHVAVFGHLTLTPWVIFHHLTGT